MIALLAIAALLPRAALVAQSTVSGVVRDSSTGQPLVGAIVTLGVGDSARISRSDGTGSFTFAGVPLGQRALQVRRLGYQPYRVEIDVVADQTSVIALLSRVATLDTVRVRAAQQAIYGAVGTARELRPLPRAHVDILGGSIGSVSVDSTGHFFFPVKTPGAYLVRAKVEGYEPQTVSVTVPRGDGVEVALLLDSATTGVSRMLDAGYADFRSRMLVRKMASALVPRGELLQSGASQMVTALKFAPSLIARALRFGPTACLFVDGIPRPGLSMNSFDPREVEAVELYGADGDPSRTLQERWPRYASCGDTGLSATTPGKDVVVWIVLWLKH